MNVLLGLGRDPAAWRLSGGHGSIPQCPGEACRELNGSENARSRCPFVKDKSFKSHRPIRNGYSQRTQRGSLWQKFHLTRKQRRQTREGEEAPAKRRRFFLKAAMQTYPKNLLPKPKGRRAVGVLPASPRASAQWRKEAHFTVLLCVVAQLALQNVPGHFTLCS